MKKLLFLAVFGLGAAGLQACPFTITNDQKSPYMVLAWGTGTGIYLTPGQTAVVTPNTVGGAKESVLHFYKVNGKELEKQYTLTQTACAVTKNETQLKISQVEKLISSPAERMKVVPFKKEGWLDTVKSWFVGKQEEKKEAPKNGTNGNKLVNGNDLQRIADKCEQEPDEKQEQCYFEGAKTLIGDVLPTGNYE